ncbi:class I SAM-dependent methyltransferase [Candidatus Gottesmanbacteria bacterium]|nr:class I SAM-dependent methyltransferase [Candidatus Gottesmanbacteria bacterium]
MEAIQIEYPNDFTEYELRDSGGYAKLERFGKYTIIRPDPRALWKPSLETNIWGKADARYAFDAKTSGTWDSPPDDSSWIIAYKEIMFLLRPTEFKHVGVFPEQAVNWNFLENKIQGKPLKILNLFAYTGGATMVGLKNGASVTHVDSAKSAIEWAKENIKLSHLDQKPVRFIQDDAYAFVLREERRGQTYDSIILDPPRFGRGSKGQVFKIEENLPLLLTACNNILSRAPSFLILNAYTADLSPVALYNLVSGVFGSRAKKIHVSEIALKESGPLQRLLPSGITIKVTF